MIDHFAAHRATFDIRAQLCTDLDVMPIEDASIEWSEEKSPYRTVARLQLPAQDAYSTARRTYFEDSIAFNPGHALDDHRPLGSINRARIKVYLRTQDYRQETNQTAPGEPRTSAEIPD